jgi:hypothetical protein
MAHIAFFRILEKVDIGSLQTTHPVKSQTAGNLARPDMSQIHGSKQVHASGLFLTLLHTGKASLIRGACLMVVSPQRSR